MPDFPAAIQNMLNGRTVRVAHMVELLLDSPKRMWNGFRDVTTSDGKTWNGLGGLGSITGLEEDDTNMQSTELRLTVSGVDAALLQTAIAEDRALYIGKLIIIWLVFFDEEWQPIETPIARKAAIIDGVDVSRHSSDEGPSVRSLSMVAQNLFYGRSLPPAAFYSNRDQQIRSPGDRGFEFVSDSIETVIPVPW